MAVVDHFPQSVKYLFTELKNKVIRVTGMKDYMWAKQCRILPTKTYLSIFHFTCLPANDGDQS